MKTHALVDPDYLAYAQPPGEPWTQEALPAIRDRLRAGYSSPAFPGYDPVAIPGPSLGISLQLCVYRPESKLHTNRPAILYLHGGGFVVGDTAMVDDYLTELAQTLGAVVVGVDYRLAPETPFPGPLEDCYAGLEWLFKQADTLQIDRHRVLVMGHSAGGGLAAALALLARDRGRYPLAGQVLIYPMLDYRTGTAEAPLSNSSTGEFYWTAEDNQFAWKCMQGAYELSASQMGYFSPALADDLSGLPTTFMAVGGLDLFLEEDVQYGMRLSRAGVPLELHVYPGVFHGFDRFPGQRSDTCRADINAALKRMLKVSL